MGVERTISADTFPQQGSHLGACVDVCFNFDTARTLSGTVVRDDKATPFITIIELEDGRRVLGTECQYRLKNGATGIPS